MKTIFSLFTASLGLICLSSQGIEVIIKAEEEKKEEDKTPDLPKPSQLIINAINRTEKFDFVISAYARVKDADYGWMEAQGVSQKGTNTAIATLNADEGASFEYKSAQVVLLGSPTNIPITCNVRSQEKEAKDGDKNDESENAAKKSIDFWLYVPKNHTLPICSILFDSF